MDKIDKKQQELNQQLMANNNTYSNKTPLQTMKRNRLLNYATFGAPARMIDRKPPSK